MIGVDGKWGLSLQEEIIFGANFRQLKKNYHPLVALLRVRNEGLILHDTLDHLSGIADVICAYDDASTDDTFQILTSHPKIGLIIKNHKWENGIEERLVSETRHRGLLLSTANSFFQFDWCICCDADERYMGSIREFVTSSNIYGAVNAIRISLFDAYMTIGDDIAIKRGVPLLNFRKFYGPERRDILMLWRNTALVRFVGLDAREPAIDFANIQTLFYCQHYGKSLSYSHWEETCDYYAKYFPWETYGKKWDSRRGAALHYQSDFGRPLYEWGSQLFLNSVKIH